MAKAPAELGPTGRRLAENVRELRRRRGLALAQLSDRLRDVDQPISLSALSKLENGQRRVDADDLVALAIALDVSPARLLLTADASGYDKNLGVTPAVETSTIEAWRWATGEQPLLQRWDEDDEFDRLARFRQESRPHHPEGTLSLREAREHADVLDPVVQAAESALESGLSLSDVTEYVHFLVQQRRRDRHAAIRDALLPRATPDGSEN